MMFKIWADCRPAAVVSKLISGPRTWVCLRLLETIFSQAGWRGILVWGGFWKRLPVCDSDLWKRGGDLEVSLRFSAHQEANSPW